MLSREPQEVELFSGRLDADRMSRILDGLLPPDTVDEWFLCGPFEMVSDLRKLLVAEGVSKKADPRRGVPRRVRAARPSYAGGDRATPRARSVTITLDGRTSTFTLPPDGPAVLDAALQVRADAPFACKGGVCGTCRAKVLEGTVEMDTNWALEPEEVERGYVLTCQSHPTSDTRGARLRRLRPSRRRRAAQTRPVAPGPQGGVQRRRPAGRSRGRPGGHREPAADLQATKPCSVLRTKRAASTASSSPAIP